MKSPRFRLHRVATVVVLMIVVALVVVLAGSPATRAGASGNAAPSWHRAGGGLMSTSAITTYTYLPAVLRFQPKKVGLVPKAAGISYFDAVRAGAQAAADETGTQLLWRPPATISAQAQIAMIDALIAQKVDAIGVSALDEQALVPAGQRAMAAGIKFMSWDSPVAPAGRLIHEAGSTGELVGRSQIQAVGPMINYQGQLAVLSSRSTDTTQNSWINWMYTELQGSQYDNMQIVEVAYGNDNFQTSYSETQRLVQTYPSLKAIVSPTTIGVRAAARALSDGGRCAQIALVGMGVPSEMATYIKNGCARAVFLWNPIDQGYLATYMALRLANGGLTPAAGQQFSAGRLGNYEVVDIGGGDLQVIQGPPFRFDITNIDYWEHIF